jgi:hypothetical protein
VLIRLILFVALCKQWEKYGISTFAKYFDCAFRIFHYDCHSLSGRVELDQVQELPLLPLLLEVNVEVIVFISIYVFDTEEAGSID